MKEVFPVRERSGNCESLPENWRKKSRNFGLVRENRRNTGRVGDFLEGKKVRTLFGEFK